MTEHEKAVGYDLLKEKIIREICKEHYCTDCPFHILPTEGREGICPFRLDGESLPDVDGWVKEETEYGSEQQKRKVRSSQENDLQ